MSYMLDSCTMSRKYPVLRETDRERDRGERERQRESILVYSILADPVPRGR